MLVAQIFRALDLAEGPRQRVVLSFWLRPKREILNIERDVVA